MPLEFLLQIIHSIVNLVTLGVYQDINSLLIPVNPVVEATLVSWGIVIVKWLAVSVAVWKLLSYIINKLVPLEEPFDIIIPLAITAALLVTTAVVVHSPVDDARSTDVRLTSWGHALTNSTEVNYTPSLLSPAIQLASKPVNMVNNSTHKIKSSIPKKVSGVKVNSSNKVFGVFPSIQPSTWDISWLSYIIYLVMIGGAVIIARKVSPALGGALAVIIACLAIGFEEAHISSIVLIMVMGFLAYLLIGSPRLERFEFLAMYPLGIMLVCLMFLLTPTKSIMVLFLLGAMALFAYTIFYLFGMALIGFGEVREGRSKLGMKKKPTKQIEEFYGKYDATAVSLILTMLFIVSFMLFGLTYFGLGVFAGLVVALMRMS